jgi:Zn-dependent peptidase ImmA (M78 family)
MRWARETAGLSLIEAAHALGLKDARGESGAQRLAKLEEGEGEPPRPLLAKMAKKYRRSLLVFYLSQPPKAGDRGQDFRTLPGAQRYNPELDALIRDLRARQGLVRSILEDEETDPLEFVGSATMDVQPAELAARIAGAFKFSLAAFRAEKNADAAFAYLRSQIEAAGAFVLLLGNLGSHHTNIPLEIFRGFAVADPLAPMIVINDQDARAAWSFTAIHEVAHLWLGKTGVSGSDGLAGIEEYCNDVAGEMLLPSNEVASLQIPTSLDSVVAAISEFAEERRVTRAMVAYKLFRLGKIGKGVWSVLNVRFRDEWIALKQKQSEKNKEGGPNYYVVRRHRVGTALIGLMRRAIDDGNITYTKAGRVLGVRPRNVEPLLSSGQVRGLR